MSITVSVLQGGANSHQTTSEEINFFGTDFISQGVVGSITNTSGVAPATGSWAVNAQGSPDMTVAVTSGTAYVTATPTSGNSQILRAKNSASANVTIAANATGGTRYDWVYIKIDPDKAKDPAVGATDVASLVISRSTSPTADNGTPPTYGYAIAVVTVANGASSITNGNITDKRVNPTVSLAQNQITTSQAATGFAVQQVNALFSAVATGTTLIPSDDTIPQITEGTEFMTQAITPKSATNVLVIDALLFLSNSTTTPTVTAALFQDSTANALAAMSNLSSPIGTGTFHIRVRHIMTAGTTSSTTFRIRGGPDGASTTTFNGQGGVRRFGGITLSSITITEYKA